ncbi:MAG: hypothetical protein L0H64_10355 [Pseudonocardia sp.]|nr:hypothetical protein [Pseudonocardia sp.]
MILQSEGTVRWEPRRGFRVIPVARDDVRDLFAVQAFIAGELSARSAPILPGRSSPRPDPAPSAWRQPPRRRRSRSRWIPNGARARCVVAANG